MLRVACATSALPPRVEGHVDRRERVRLSLGRGFLEFERGVFSGLFPHPNAVGVSDRLLS